MLPTAEALSNLEHSLAQFVLDDRWKHLHLVEFDLKGQLNPSRMLDHLFFTSGELPSFPDFCDTYLKTHFATIKTLYGELLALKKAGNITELRDKMSVYAYGRFQWALREGVSDQELQQNVRARLYRTLAGIYTEYHGYYLSCHLCGQANVKRSAELDSRGIDFMLLLSSNTFNVHVIRNSERAISALKSKLATKKVAQADGVHVVLPYGIHGDLPESTRPVGKGFYIFREEYIVRFCEVLQTYNQTDGLVIYKSGRLLVSIWL